MEFHDCPSLDFGIVCLIILFINYLTRYSYENEPSRIYDIEPVTNIKKCDFHPSCKSFGYVLIGEKLPWIDYLLSDISNKSKLDPIEDMELLYQGENVTQALTDIKKKNSNSFATIVIFCTSQFEINDRPFRVSSTQSIRTGCCTTRLW